MSTESKTGLWGAGTARARRTAVSLILPAVVGLCANGCSKAFRVTEHMTLSAPLPAERLSVKNQRGNVTVVADASATEIRAEVTKTGRGVTLKAAQEAVGEIQVHLAPEQGEVGVIAAAAEHPRQSNKRAYEVEWKLTAPPEVIVEVHNQFGDVAARGFHRGVDARSGFGDLTAEAAGPTRLDTDFGDIEMVVLEVNPGDVVARTDFGDIDVQIPLSRAGRVTAGSDFGEVDVSLENMTLKLKRLRHHRFDAELGGSDRPTMELGTDFGDVTVRAR